MCDLSCNGRCSVPVSISIVPAQLEKFELQTDFLLMGIWALLFTSLRSFLLMGIWALIFPNQSMVCPIHDTRIMSIELSYKGYPHMCIVTALPLALPLRMNASATSVAIENKRIWLLVMELLCAVACPNHADSASHTYGSRCAQFWAL